MASRSSSVLVCLSVLGALVSACSVGTTPALPDLGFSFDLDGGSTAVDGAPPADAGPLPTGCVPEICANGLDDNCDGRIEEGCACLPGEESACFGGTAETRTRGACQDGRMVCAEGLEWGTWGDCVGDVTAEAEECDVAEVDEDCDGAQNEGCECTGAEPIPCGSGVGICREGIQECLDGLRGECIGATAPGVEECNGLDDNCDGATDEALSRECGSAVGECATGTQTCIGGAWEACSGAREPADEACDSLDNDCDGTIDEELDRACGSAVGECLAGTQSCVSGEWAACAGETLPLLEVCNGLDDDCDGTTDEAISRPCGTDTGECTAGSEACVAGAWGSCTGSIGPRVDACDGVLDENCDGVVDEGCGCVTGAARPCGTDIGACTAGTETCSTAGAWGSCTGAVGGAVEICNAIDDDCDGLTDESLTRPCGTDTGACTAGTETCSGGSFGACAGAIGPVAERCDGIVDDDCDGIVDDGCGCTNGATRLCGTDTGACVAGRETCNLAGTWGTCIGAVGPVVETCNGVDDDCDSSVDETLSRACGTDAGECVAGIESCSAGAWGTCVGSIAPRTEVCDGALDEDCDMIVDEGCGCTNGATRACGTDTGVCVAGLQTCSGGMWAGCIGAVGPGVESCNNLDDNCDGRTDESLSRSCGTDVGACVAGTETCSAGTYAACVGSIGPVAERCDGSVDDDCDGLVDDGCTCTTGTTRSCGTDFGACVAGLETCDVAGRWGVCTGGIGPVTEICDDIDNDCDRSTDEGLSRVCGTDVGACVVGAETCSRGAWGTCSGGVGPATELCDGAIDQDCDGLLDEGCVCINAQTRTCGTDVGDCVAGAETCNLMGVWGACTGSVGPTTEVCDGRDNDCDAATDEGVCITVPPLAMCPAGLTAAVLSTVTLSGSGSDPDGGTVRFTWTVTARPVGSTSVPASPTASTTSFFLDAAGTYTVQFCAIDDESVSTCCNVTIVSTPPGILHVELSWSTAWGDMDLHLRNVGYTGTTAWFTTNDCFYGNRTPDWGAAGAVANPTLDRDDLDGYGPENATITTSPAAGTYTVAAHYYCDRSTGGTGDASATVRIYCMGALVRTVTGIVFDETDEWVTVATVTWPSCATTLVGGMSTYGSALVPAGVTPHCEMSCAVDGDCHTGEVCRTVAGGGPPRRACLHL